MPPSLLTTAFISRSSRASPRSATQIGALVDCLNALPDAPTCKTFFANAANKSCARCAITAATAATYGPLVEDSVTIDVNEAGCIALATGDVSTAGCGAKVLALRQCEELACEVNCPVPAGDDGTAFAADVEEDAGPAAVCVQAGAMFFADNAKAMVKLFCGGIPSDGGVGDAADGG